jgi:hypothetical protein
MRRFSMNASESRYHQGGEIAELAHTQADGIQPGPRTARQSVDDRYLDLVHHDRSQGDDAEEDRQAPACPDAAWTDEGRLDAGENLIHRNFLLAFLARSHPSRGSRAR